MLVVIRTGAFRSKQHENEIDGLIVHGFVFDRRFQPRKHAYNLFDGRKPAVRNGDSLPHARGSKAFAFVERVEDSPFGKVDKRGRPTRQFL